MNKKQSIPIKPLSTDRILEKVRGEGLTEKGLIALHHNAVRLHALDVVEAVEIKLWAEFPRAAKKLLGDRKPAAAAPLEAVHAAGASESLHAGEPG